MRLSSALIIAVTFAAAGAAAFVGAGIAVTVIEDTTVTTVRDALDRRNMPWAEVEADGLQVKMSGRAPSEADRFNALTAAGGIVDAARVLDQMTVADSAEIAPPRFSLEILRNDAGISLIGLIPAESDRADLVERLQGVAGDGAVTDLLETADYPMPDGWPIALSYALRALKSLPRAKVSVDAENVAITAISDSSEARRKLETELVRTAPSTLKLQLDISAPRPVLTPFTLRFVRDEAGARFDACSADTEAARDRILRAATKAGLQDKGACTLALGVPSPSWADAAELAIAALADLGQGSVTFADADITLVAAEGTEQAAFDRVVGELENALPDVFALHSVLPETPATDSAGPPEFIATLSPEGQVQLRGRVTDELRREAADSYARARFGSGVVRTTARLDDTLPEVWPVRVLAGIEVLSRLSNGAVTVSPDLVTVIGNTGNPEALAEISGLLAEKLGQDSRFEIDVTYRKRLDPVAGLPTPDECEAEIQQILAERKINFEPGSDTVDAEGRVILDDIAEILKRCGEMRFEIAGHTDSQGRETMNQQLSQSRAQAVLNELRKRRVLTAGFEAKGYGEERPIADNATEEGREANRRIEFTLVRPEPVPETTTTLETMSQSGSESSTGDDPEAASGAAGGTETDADTDDGSGDAEDDTPTGANR